MKNISGSLSKAKKIESRIVSSGFKTYMEELLAGRVLKHSDFDVQPDSVNPIKTFNHITTKPVICAFTKHTYFPERVVLEGPKKTFERHGLSITSAVMKVVRDIEEHKAKAVKAGLFYTTLPQLIIKKTLFGYRALISFRSLEGVVVS